MMRRLLMSSVLLLLALLAWRFANPTATAATASIAEEQRRRGIPVEVALPLHEDMAETVDFEGSIEAVTDLDCVFEIEGRVVALEAEVGQVVKTGELLGRIDAASFRHHLDQATAVRLGAEAEWSKIRAGARKQEQAQAAALVTEAEAALKLAEQEMERVTAMAAKKAATSQQLDGVRAQHRMAEARLRQARQGLSLVREGARAEDRLAVKARLDGARAAEALARLNLSHTELRAPFEGVVAEKFVEEGRYVVKMPSPTEIYRLVKIDTVQLVGRVSELDVARLRLGQTVRVDVDALGKTMEGRLSEIDPVGDAKQRAFRVEVRIANPGHELKPAMFGRARIVIREAPAALAVDRRWLLEQKGEEARVWVVDGDQARIRNLRIGLREGTHLQVLEGIAPKDRIVVSGGRGLSEGDRLRVTVEGRGGES